LRSILREDPGNSQAHLRLGYALLGAGRAREADRHFRAAIDGGLSTADAWLGVAQCAGARGALPEAEAALRRADSVEPGNPVVAANLAILCSKTGRNEEALALLARVVRDDPQFDEARFNLALAYARAGRREEALAEARELLRRLPVGAPQRPEVERLAAALAGR
jgi:tetratricopeptide (TPR) repeat protein